MVEPEAVPAQSSAPSAVEPLQVEHPVAALGLVAGPAAFITAWVVGGLVTDGYSPIDQAISRLAAESASHPQILTAGLLTFAGAMAVGAVGLRGSTLHRLWPVALANAAAAVAVAATPLEHADRLDALHGVAAASAYVALAAMPLLGAAPLRRSGRRREAAWSTALGLGVAASLVATQVTEASGLAQRVGLTLGDVWLVSAGIALFRAGRR
jgi:hypothetical protein